MDRFHVSHGGDERFANQQIAFDDLGAGFPEPARADALTVARERSDRVAGGRE